MEEKGSWEKKARVKQLGLDSHSPNITALAERGGWPLPLKDGEIISWIGLKRDGKNSR